jgi:hypothetical protein
MIVKNKVVLIDWSVFIHKSIFAWRNNKEVSPGYTAMNMVIASLKNFFLSPEDIVIFALDSHDGKSWRKALDRNYKANRKEKRDKSEDIDWKYMFKQFDNLLEILKISTPFHYLIAEGCEADDIISVAVRLYKDMECIIVSTDSDYEQLACFDNVKLYSPQSKKFKEVSNPYQILAKKIEKETADNLVTKITNKKEYDIRNKIVNLMELPEEIEERVGKVFENVRNKEYDLEKFPFISIRKRFMDIYNQKPRVIKRKKKRTKIEIVKEL